MAKKNNPSETPTSLSLNTEEVRFDEAQSSEFNPFGQDTVSREYSAPKIETNITEDLPEPQFHKKSFDEIKQQSSATISTAQGTTPSPAASIDNGPSSQPQTVNPAMNQLDDKEKRKAAEQMVDAVLDTYDQIWMGAAHLARVKEEPVIEMINTGQIDGNRRIPIDEHGNTVSILNLIQSFNQEMKKAVQPDEQFRRQVRPPMTRIFAEKGWGMTDTQIVIYAFGKDAAIKGITLFSINKSAKDILERMVEENIGQGAPAPRQSAQPQQNTPPPPPPPATDTFNFDNVPQPPSPPVTSNEILTPEAETVTDADLEFENRQEAMAKSQAETESATTKHNISQFDDNPLVSRKPVDYPAPTVTETFTKSPEVD